MALGAAVLFCAAAPGRAQDPARLLDSVVTANSWSLTLNQGTLSGPGARFLLREGAQADFVALGEEHNSLEIPQLASALFHALQPAGYQYFADEQDAVTLRLVSELPRRHVADSIVAIARRYLHAFTFMSDQELAMLADIDSASQGSGRHLWGCDQVFGATHVLDQLIPLLSGDPRAEALRLRDWAAGKERVRDLATYSFMTSEPKADSLARLATLAHAAPGSDAERLIQSLVISDRIYWSHEHGHRYEANAEREEYLKARFLDEYRGALAADRKRPKVVLKFGDVHLVRGLGPTNLQSLGDFVSQFAVANGVRSFHVVVWSAADSGGYADLRQRPDHIPFRLSTAAAPDRWTVLDLRSLRPLFDRLSAGMTPEDREHLRYWIFGYDAALFVGRMHRATYDLNPGVQY